MSFSIVIPVYNRPQELAELLDSLAGQKGDVPYEVIVVEDGSEITSERVVNQYSNKIDIKYCFKNNSGPGDSRNYGMHRASGNYFILLDSDCVLPDDYLLKVQAALTENFSEAFGGPDSAHPSFSAKQKAINYAMTSLLSTGGLRGADKQKDDFQIRSFNMGLSARAFALTGGFSRQRIGEDIDLNFRLLNGGCSKTYFPEVFVYHKRRSTWAGFFRQVMNFGAARPVLNRIHPNTWKISYWLPSLFLLGLVAGLVLLYFGFPYLILIFLVYFAAVAVDATSRNRNLWVGLLSCWAVFLQFTGYGMGFLRSAYRMHIQRKSNQEAFPGMFA